MSKEYYLSTIGMTVWSLRPQEKLSIVPFFRDSQLFGAIIANGSIFENTDSKSYKLVEAILKTIKCELNRKVIHDLNYQNLAGLQLVVTFGEPAKQYAVSKKINKFIALVDPTYPLTNPLEKRAIWKLLKMGSKSNLFI